MNQATVGAEGKHYCHHLDQLAPRCVKRRRRSIDAKVCATSSATTDVGVPAQIERDWRKAKPIKSDLQALNFLKSALMKPCELESIVSLDARWACCGEHHRAHDTADLVNRTAVNWCMYSAEGGTYPAKEYCSNCGLCDSYYIAHVKDACAFLGPGSIALLSFLQLTCLQ